MPFDKDFWTRLATKHKLTEEQINAIASNEALLQDIDEMVLRRDEYKGLKEQTEAEKQAAAKARQDALAKYQENLQWYGSNEAKLRQVDAYRAKYGDLTGDGGGNGGGGDPVISSPLTIEEIDKRIRSGQREVYGLSKQLIKASRDYEKRFGTEFPFEEVEAIALKPENAGRDIKDIYNDFVAPKVEAKMKTDFDEKLKSAREEGFKDGLAKGRIREPNASFPDEPNPFYEQVDLRDAARTASAKDKGGAPDAGTLQKNFVETYYKNMEPAGAST